MCNYCLRESGLIGKFSPEPWSSFEFHIQAAGLMKMLHAFPIDGVGDFKPIIGQIGLIVTADEAGDGIGLAPGNPVITVGAPMGVATTNSIGDQDFFQVTLEAGKLYEIGQYALVGGPNGVPQADAYIELYDAAGNLIVSADGGGPNTPSGLDALLVFEAQVTGTYYVNFRAYDEDPTNGTTGDTVGDYNYFVNELDPNDPNIYQPYYDVDDPLYALDWGSQVNRVNQSARNPDGDEGTRPTGNDPGTPVFAATYEYDVDDDGTNEVFDINGLAAAQGKDITGKNVITIYFARAGDVFDSLEDPTNPGLPPLLVAVGTEQFERDTVWTALGEFEKVADVIYLEVDNRDHADFFFATYAGTPGPGVSLLGSMAPPDYPNEGLAQFNSGDYRWNEQDLQQGGFSFVTLIHEFGHGHGLSHPHDNGGRSGIMRGVEPEGPIADYTTGDFDLNQAVFTMMSYEDGWQTSPYGNAPTDVGYGYLGGLMAFDIAAIQDKYGVNEEWATGDDTYVLKDVNEAGTFYYSIWDAGGTDEIVFDGSIDAVIDLRPATLEYEEGGGGRLSYVFGIYGGFTIANGVTIENARTGAGNDRLIGNAVDNVLDGGDGDDSFFLQVGGDDMAIGGGGHDGFYFGGTMTTADGVNGGAGIDSLALQGNYAGLVLGNVTGVEVLLAVSGSDDQFGDTAGNLYSYNITSADANVAANAVFTVQGTGLLPGESLVFDGSAETDGHFRMFAGQGDDNLTGGMGSDGFLFGADGNFTGADRVHGGANIDSLALRGNYTGAGAAVFEAESFTGIEVLVLLSGHTNEFGGFIVPEGFDYEVVTADGNVGAGQQLDVHALNLRDNESLSFDGRAETDGSFRILSGAGDDILYGGAGDDTIYGGLGADLLEGDGGADTYLYRDVAESTANQLDQLFFGTGDRIDLSMIDANAGTGANDAFAFIGSAAFSNTAGELRVVQQNNQWIVEGDVDGDGIADLMIAVTASQPLVVGDFVL